MESDGAIKRVFLALLQIVYVMTDFTHNNFNFWEDHPSLKPFLANGMLDSAIFDAVNDSEIKLAHSKKVRGPLFWSLVLRCVRLYQAAVGHDITITHYSMQCIWTFLVRKQSNRMLVQVHPGH